MRIRLTPVTEEVFDALASREMFLARFGADAPCSIEIARVVARQSLDFYARTGVPEPWIGYLGIDEDARTLVAHCGYKGDPRLNGEVEIAYMTLPGFEGRGVATACAAALYRLACASERVRAVLAHTLPERNASCRVLERNGFTFAGEVVDPEDGPVWRWRRGVDQR